MHTLLGHFTFCGRGCAAVGGRPISVNHGAAQYCVEFCAEGYHQKKVTPEALVAMCHTEFSSLPEARGEPPHRWPIARWGVVYVHLLVSGARIQRFSCRA